LPESRPPVIFHPFVVAFFPLLSLYLHNAGKLYFSEVVPPLLLALLLSAAFWWITTRLLKDVQKAAIVTTAFFALFFTYGHLLPLLERSLRGLWPALTLDSTGALALLLGCLVGFWLLLIWLLVRAVLNFRVINQFLNGFAIALIIILAYRFGAFVRYREMLWRQADAVAAYEPVTAVGNVSVRPDIYYIVVDGYGRADVLLDLYDLDTTDFLGFLRERGFYTARQSNANYNITLLSLASTLNFDYLDPVAAQLDPDSTNPLPVFNLIQHNRLMQYFQAQGYTVVNFATGYTATELAIADVKRGPTSSLSAFENALINTTPLRLFLSRKQFDSHRDKILYTLEHLPDATQIEGPVFVFAHIVAPHPPFVLAADGTALYPDMGFVIDDGDALTHRLSREAYLRGYREQAQFMSRSLEQALSQILAQSSSPPIIILQGDHGPGAYLDWESLENSNVRERLGILNAYYFPDQEYSALYPTISPVNSFRVVLNQYFGAAYPLLEDRNYFALMAQPYRFMEVTQQVLVP